MSKLKDIGIIVTGNTPSKKNSEYYESNDIMFVKPGDIEEEYITSIEKSEEYISEKAREKARILPKGSVLVTCIGTIGKVGILKQEATCNQQINAIIPNDKVLSEYLAYLIQSKQKVLQLKANAPVVPIINKKDFSEIEVNICDLKRQEEIVKQLNLLKSIIDKRKKQIEKLDELIKSQFVEMFGNIKLNDKGWSNVDKIGNVCTLNPKKNEIYGADNIEVSFIPMQNVSEKGDIDTSEIRRLDEVKKGFTYFKENDVLFAKITPCMENGKGAVAKGLKNNIGFGSTEFHVIRPTNKVNSVWIYTYTTFKSFRKEAERKMTGSAGQKRVPIKFFENYEIAIPPIELQNKFAEFVKQIDKQKVEIKKSLKEMQELYESLMDKYFG